MNFEQFNQVALDDPLTLMVAMELLLQNGRGMIQSRKPRSWSRTVRKASAPSLPRVSSGRS